mmetsp:Transcript_6263/g.9933  ORF Transcript_6263/g.9933 Transcript_6263/m.9933 type:complete len:212 (+) Transcript_6263:75-710(+)
MEDQNSMYSVVTAEQWLAEEGGNTTESTHTPTSVVVDANHETTSTSVTPTVAVVAMDEHDRDAMLPQLSAENSTLRTQICQLAAVLKAKDDLIQRLLMSPNVADEAKMKQSIDEHKTTIACQAQQIGELTEDKQRLHNRISTLQQHVDDLHLSLQRIRNETQREDLSVRSTNATQDKKMKTSAMRSSKVCKKRSNGNYASYAAAISTKNPK